MIQAADIGDTMTTMKLFHLPHPIVMDNHAAQFKHFSLSVGLACKQNMNRITPLHPSWLGFGIINSAPIFCRYLYRLESTDMVSGSMSYLISEIGQV